MKRLPIISIVFAILLGLLFLWLASPPARGDYLGSWKINDYVPIPVTTHRFSSGAAYAPTVLTYSIYEDGNAVGLDENVDMTVASPFDSVVGFYLARRQLTGAAGFEKGKNYTVLVKATVDSVAAITQHTFQIGAEVDAEADANLAALLTTVQDDNSVLHAAILTRAQTGDSMRIVDGTGVGEILTTDGVVDVVGEVESVANIIRGSILQASVVATVASATEFTITIGSAHDDIYNDRTIVLADSSLEYEKTIGRVSDYNGVSKTIYLDADPTPYTVQVNDTVYILTDKFNALQDAIATRSPASTALSSATWTPTRAGYLDMAISDVNGSGGDANGVMSLVLAQLVVQDTNVATAGTASQFTLTAGKASADAYKWHCITVTDANDSTKETRLISDYTAGRVVTVSSPFTFTPAEGDVVRIWAIAYNRPRNPVSDPLP